MSIGKVWLVGAGPSDKGLFTLKGKEVLEKADVVVYDQLVGEGIFRMIPAKAKKIDVGKHAGNHKVVQEDINEILLREALEGKRVVRLKGGDPFLFGRGGEEIELLCQNGIPFEIVPGVTSAISVPAYAGIPVTHRDFTSSLHIITGHKKQGCEESINYKSLVDLGEVTLVFLMGVAALPEIAKGLIAAGMKKDMPAAILERGTTYRQRRVVATIETLPDMAAKEQIKTPGIIVVGKVCSLSENFSWAEKRPLHGARVIVTRPRAKASKLTEKLTDLGAEVVEIPCIETMAVGGNEKLNEVITKIQEYDWIAFSSEVAVTAFFDQLLEKRIDIRSLSNCHFAAVGPTTKKSIEQRGVLVDYMPEQYYGEALAKGLSKLVTKQEKALVFTPENLDSDLAQSLSMTEIAMEAVPIYETDYVQNEPLELEHDDYVAFTSASTVRGFAMMMGDADLSKVNAICIGNQTAKEATALQMNVTVANEATIDGMVECMLELHQRK